MKEIELAVQYLKRRAVSAEKVNNKLMKQFIAVLPVSEVEAVLGMVKSGEFLRFYNDMKEKGHPDCF
jgi:hypothetical protein